MKIRNLFVGMALAGSVALTPAAHAETVILDIGKMTSPKTVTIQGLGSVYAAPMQFTATYGGRNVDLLAWCVDVYHHITLADYKPNLVYTDTNALTNDFAPAPRILTGDEVVQIGTLAHYGQNVFDEKLTAPINAAVKPTAVPAFTQTAPKAPVAPKAPTPPTPPTPPAANASQATKNAYAAKLATYNTAKATYDTVTKPKYDTDKAAYDTAKAVYDTAKANYDAAKAAYDAAKAKYAADLTKYNADTAAYNLALKNYNSAVALRNSTLSAVQSAIWQISSRKNVYSTDAAFDLLVDGLSGLTQLSFADYMRAGYGDGSSALKMITPTATGKSATQSFVIAVPEPATWALMILGFGAVGGMLRARRRQGLAAA